MRTLQRRQQAIVLIVVIGVLAVLSLLAATFGMLMSVELSASRNQTEAEMAREAAQAAAAELTARVDAFVRVNGYMPADLNEIVSPGVVSTTQDSPSVTGSGTRWTGDWVGKQIMIDGFGPYGILFVTDATHLTLARNFTDGNLSNVRYQLGDRLGSLELYRRDKVKVYTALGPCGTPPTAWTLPLGRSFHVALSGWCTEDSTGSNFEDGNQSWAWDDLVGWYVIQTSGAGAGEFRRIVHQGTDASSNDPIRRAVSPVWTVAPIAGTEYWIVPSVYSGEFNLNAMGYGGDLGNEDSGNYRTSFDASLRRLILAGFNAMPPDDKATVAAHIGGFGDTPSVRQRVAGAIAEAIIAWRNGNDRMAGDCLTWNNRPFGDSDVSVTGVWQPGMTAQQETAPGIMWGRLALNGAVTATNNVILDTGSGFMPWGTSNWIGATLVFGSGASKGKGPNAQKSYIVSGNSASTLTLSNADAYWTVNPTFEPGNGDAFCLYPPGSVPAWFSAADDDPDGIQWPDGTVMTEGGVLWRVFDGGKVTGGVTGAGFTADRIWTVNHANCLVWLTKGTGAGQVRIIAGTPVGGSTLTILGTWAGNPAVDTEFKLLYPVPQVSGAVSSGEPWGLTDNSKVGQWKPNQFQGGIVFIWEGSGKGQARWVSTNNANGYVTINGSDPAWSPQPDTTSRYGIAFAGDPLQYNPLKLVRDDRAFTSVPDILPAIIDALADAPVSLSASDAGNVGSILYNSIRDYLTAVPARMPVDTVCINDWANDGYDDDLDGSVDEADETAPTAQRLYAGLGLDDWAGTDVTRINQAAQLVANIIDFRDADSTPTKLVAGDIDDLGTDIYGAEGLHLTEVICTQEKIFSTTGNEITDDYVNIPTPPPANSDNDRDFNETSGGHDDNDGWDWIDAEGRWVAFGNLGDPQKTGRWTFDNPALMDGVYSIRLRGNDGEPDLNVKFNADSTPYVASVGAAPKADGNYWGYAKTGAGKLAAVTIADHKLTMEITAEPGSAFYGFQLLPQFIEFTNCATSDIVVPVGAWTITTEKGTIPFPWGASATTIPGASADGKFPINYGSVVVALGEAAYDGQWGDAKNGVWGDTVNENYPVLFVENSSANASVVDGYLDAMLLADQVDFNYSTGTVTVPNSSQTVTGADGADWSGLSAPMTITIGTISATVAAVVSATELQLEDPWPGVGEAGAAYMLTWRTRSVPAVKLAVGGTLLAGDVLDGLLPAVTIPHTSIEKTILLQPTYGVTAGLWLPHNDDPAAEELSASQNRHVTAPNDFYTNLNAQWGLIWDVYPTTMEAGLTASQVLPIILNRPYPGPAWLGLVPTSNRSAHRYATDPDWHTIDANPDWATSVPREPEEMLGMLMDHACVGHDFARINLNTAPFAVLRSVLPAANAEKLLNAREGTTPWHTWQSWDELLTAATFASTTGVNDIGFNGNGIEDSGANSFGDDFTDDSDEKEEWARRYGNIFTVRSQTMKYVVAGLVYDQMTTRLYYADNDVRLTAGGATADGNGTAWKSSGVLPGMDIIVYGTETYRGVIKSVVDSDTLTLTGALPNASQAGATLEYEIRLRAPLAQSRLEVELEQTAGGVVVRGWRYLTD